MAPGRRAKWDRTPEHPDCQHPRGDGTARSNPPRPTARRYPAARLDHLSVWFDGFRTLKFIHTLRSRQQPDVSYLDAWGDGVTAPLPLNLRNAMAENWGWRWTNYVIAIFGGGLAVVTFVFVREPSRTYVREIL